MLEAREDGRAQEDGEEEPGKGRFGGGGGGVRVNARRPSDCSFKVVEFIALYSAFGQPQDGKRPKGSWRTPLGLSSSPSRNSRRLLVEPLEAIHVRYSCRRALPMRSGS